MKTKKLGSSELEFSVIGLGTWAMGGGGWNYSWGKQDDKESEKTIKKAMDLGINWIDTAPVYGLGHAERLVGRTIRKMQEKPFIATKCGLVWKSNGKISGKLRKDSIKFEIEESLKRLSVDAIDLYQIHWPRPECHIEEAWETILELVQEGKIRYAGVSNFTVDQVEKLKKMGLPISVQSPYSILKRAIEDDLLSFCSCNNIEVLAYSTMQKGLLTGLFDIARISQFPVDDHRRWDPFFRDPKINQVLFVVQGLVGFAKEKGITASQLAIAWVLRRDEITSAIVGARNPSQIEETSKAADFTLSYEDMACIDQILCNI
ncbi:MAG: aldo/keto reductase [Candidatus Theseobacter exili]|nr:aldo/keto reductase [Candidatus Theseobacter exili]